MSASQFKYITLEDGSVQVEPPRLYLRDPKDPTFQCAQQQEFKWAALHLTGAAPQGTLWDFTLAAHNVVEAKLRCVETGQIQALPGQRLEYRDFRNIPYRNDQKLDS